MDIDLTALTDSELLSLFQRIHAERERRTKFLEVKKNIVELTLGYLDVGGKKEDLLAAIDEGEAEKIRCDGEELEKFEPVLTPEPPVTEPEVSSEGTTTDGSEQQL